MKKRAMLVMLCAICFVASLVAVGCVGIVSTGALNRMHTMQSKLIVVECSNSFSKPIA